MKNMRFLLVASLATSIMSSQFSIAADPKTATAQERRSRSGLATLPEFEHLHLTKVSVDEFHIPISNFGSGYTVIYRNHWLFSTSAVLSALQDGSKSTLDREDAKTRIAQIYVRNKLYNRDNRVAMSNNYLYRMIDALEAAYRKLSGDSESNLLGEVASEIMAAIDTNKLNNGLRLEIQRHYTQFLNPATHPKTIAQLSVNRLYLRDLIWTTDVLPGFQDEQVSRIIEIEGEKIGSFIGGSNNESIYTSSNEIQRLARQAVTAPQSLQAGDILDGMVNFLSDAQDIGSAYYLARLREYVARMTAPLDLNQLQWDNAQVAGLLTTVLGNPSRSYLLEAGNIDAKSMLRRVLILDSVYKKKTNNAYSNLVGEAMTILLKKIVVDVNNLYADEVKNKTQAANEALILKNQPANVEVYIANVLAGTFGLPTEEKLYLIGSRLMTEFDQERIEKRDLSPAEQKPLSQRRLALFREVALRFDLIMQDLMTHENRTFMQLNLQHGADQLLVIDEAIYRATKKRPIRDQVDMFVKKATTAIKKAKSDLEVKQVLGANYGLLQLASGDVKSALKIALNSRGISHYDEALDRTTNTVLNHIGICFDALTAKPK